MADIQLYAKGDVFLHRKVAQLLSHLKTHHKLQCK